MKHFNLYNKPYFETGVNFLWHLWVSVKSPPGTDKLCRSYLFMVIYIRMGGSHMIYNIYGCRNKFISNKSALFESIVSRLKSFLNTMFSEWFTVVSSICYIVGCIKCYPCRIFLVFIFRPNMIDFNNPQHFYDCCKSTETPGMKKTNERISENSHSSVHTYSESQ